MPQNKVKSVQAQKDNFIKAVKSGVDFLCSLIPYLLSLFNIADINAIINFVGIFSAMKNISSCLTDIYKYFDNRNNKFICIVNVLSLFVYVIYIPVVVICYIKGVGGDFAVAFSYVVLGLAPMKDLFSCVLYTLRTIPLKNK